MRPVRTKKTTGIYGAPSGLEDKIGGLPFYREPSGIEHMGQVVSVWTFEPEERAYIARGGNLVIGILGQEPIPPVSVSLRGGPDDDWFNEIAEHELSK